MMFLLRSQDSLAKNSLLGQHWHLPRSHRLLAAKLPKKAIKPSAVDSSTECGAPSSHYPLFGPPIYEEPTMSSWPSIL